MSVNEKYHSAFTLIELLMVVGVLSVLMVAVILVINPVQHLKQARDTNRLTDIETLHKAVSLFMFNNPNGELGVTGDVYVSIPSNQTDCSDLGLPAGPTYHCVDAAHLLKNDGTGWVPVNLTMGSITPPIPKLPIDPINTVADGFYYAYVPNYQLTAGLESTKYITQYPDNLVSKGLTSNTPDIILDRAITLPSAYYALFYTSLMYKGNLGGRSGADTKCNNDSNKPVDCVGDAWALISVDASDEIRDMLTTKSVNIAYSWWWVRGTLASQAGTNWADLFDNSIMNPASSVGYNGSPSTGSLEDGSQASDTCNNWTNSESGTAVNGWSNAADIAWLKRIYNTCASLNIHMCACFISN